MKTIVSFLQKRTRAARFVLAAALAATLAAAGAAASQNDAGATLLKVRVGGDSAQTRLVIELDHNATSRLLSSDTASRKVVVALPHVSIAGDMAGQGAGLVKSWAIDDVAGAARLKLALTQNAVVKRRFLLAPGDGLNVYRYVIDLSTDGASPPAHAANAPLASAEAAEDAIHPPVQPLTPTRRVVVIDAGHGGKDSGALGARTQEKNDTLAAAHVLRDKLEATGRYKVVMTRDTDAFIPLETRVQIARRANADLFISLHADSIGVEGAATRGASVYTLSERGADRTARGVLGRSDWFMNVSVPGQDSATKRILLDLTQRQNVNRSSTFAEMLLSRIADKTVLLRRSHRDANLMVLLAPDVPAVLLEMGFITNPEDEKALADPDHRQAVMGAVANAIDDYFGQERRYAMR